MPSSNVRSRGPGHRSPVVHPLVRDGCHRTLVLLLGLLAAGSGAGCSSGGNDTDSPAGCGCFQLAGDTRMIHQALNCAPAAELGATTLAQAERERCASTLPTLFRLTGCGKVVLTNGDGVGGVDQVFDARSGALIGALLFSDTPFGACGSFAYQYGETGRFGAASLATCAAVDKCALCGQVAADNTAACR